MEGRNYSIFTLLQVTVGCGLLWFVLAFPKPWDWQRQMGTALLFAGMIGIAVARYQLGRSFSVRAQAKQLVTRGIYSRIRNPIYVFGTVMIIGIVLIVHKTVGWLFVLFVIVMQTIRAQREARVLEAAFGDAYREYRRKTWF